MTGAITADTELPAWVCELQEHFTSTYLDDHGMMMINMNRDGSADFSEPVIADFGDILPFLWHLGMHDFVESQLKLARGRLVDGLYVRNGRTRLFLNHDWLLGLIDLYRQSHDPNLLEMALQGARTIARDYFRGDLLIDEIPGGSAWRTWLAPASPFNGGYIELWLDLHRYAESEGFLALAERLGRGWKGTPDFREHGVFSRVQTTRSAVLNRVVVSRSRLRSRLFKDNTNLLWGILTLFQRTGDEVWRDAVIQWVRGFERVFFNGGRVFLMAGPDMSGYNVSLKAAFSSLDLLCDIHHEGIAQDTVRRLACSIADYWLTVQWENGLFPENPEGEEDHLDANVDMVVGLAKLYAITGNSRYLQALTDCREAVLDKHKLELGYCQTVGRDGKPRDSRIKIKYQGLLTKLALLPNDPSGIFQYEPLMELLRDR